MVCSAAEQTVGVKVSCVKKGWRVVQDSLCVEQWSMWVSCELFDCLSLRRCSTDWLVCSISHEKNDCSHLKHWKRVVYSLHVWKYVVSIAEYIARICGFQHTSYIFIYFLINQHIYVFLWHPHDFMVYHPFLQARFVRAPNSGSLVDGWNMFHTAGVESTTYWPGGGE
jgi:hypothetical protein